MVEEGMSRILEIRPDMRPGVTLGLGCGGGGGRGGGGPPVFYDTIEGTERHRLEYLRSYRRTSPAPRRRLEEVG